MLMILSFFTQKLIGSAKMKFSFDERFSDDGQAHFAINNVY